jgi:hypothetical protein
MRNVLSEPLVHYGLKPELNDMPCSVRSEWIDAKQLELRNKFYEELTARYNVTIEPHQNALSEWMDLRKLLE